MIFLSSLQSEKFALGGYSFIFGAVVLPLVVVFFSPFFCITIVSSSKVLFSWLPMRWNDKHLNMKNQMWWCNQREVKVKRTTLSCAQQVASLLIEWRVCGDRQEVQRLGSWSLVSSFFNFFITCRRSESSKRSTVVFWQTAPDLEYATGGNNAKPDSSLCCSVLGSSAQSTSGFMSHYKKKLVIHQNFRQIFCSSINKAFPTNFPQIILSVLF